MDKKNTTASVKDGQKAVDQDPNALMTPDEIALECRVGVSTIYGWLSSGLLKGKKLGGVWRVRRGTLREFKGDVDLFGGAQTGDQGE